jgi:hypothetical protein
LIPPVAASVPRNQTTASTVSTRWRGRPTDGALAPVVEDPQLAALKQQLMQRPRVLTAPGVAMATMPVSPPTLLAQSTAGLIASVDRPLSPSMPTTEGPHDTCGHLQKVPHYDYDDRCGSDGGWGRQPKAGVDQRTRSVTC